MATLTRNWSTFSDEELVAAARYHDSGWIDELLHRYEERLLRCAHAMVSPAEVEDATQEISERILMGLPSFRGDSAVSTWIFAVARNTCLDIRRRRKPVANSPEAVLENLPGMNRPEDAFDISILGCRTALAIKDLPEAQAKVVVLRLGLGFSTAEAAVQLGVTNDAVKARLRRARQHLRSDLTRAIACPECGPGTYSIVGTTVI